MTLVALIRHAETEWNQAGRLQGHVDVPLSEAGRSDIAARALPPELGGMAWVASPLGRALETASLLEAREVETEPRLIEMDWGEWEGRTLESLRAELGPALAENEARGLDFKPAGGESPRAVQTRVRPWLAEVARRGTPTAAVTHKGVIRAILALACEWDMTGKAPHVLDWGRAHLFNVEADGAARPERLNLPLEAP